jgi:hypothetical protein
MKYLFVRTSGNQKTGPIPQTYNHRSTCPPSCAHYRTSCYAESFHTRLHWEKVDARGLDIVDLALSIRLLPKGQLWRFAVAGDLPGQGETVDAYELGELVKANRGRRGFTYTHKHGAEAIKWAKHATVWGFTVNLSADDAGHADQLAAHGLPVVVVVPVDTPRYSMTPEGRHIIVCPTQTTKHITCETCGLCQRADRTSIVGFRAHGTKTRLANMIASRVIPIARADV